MKLYSTKNKTIAVVFATMAIILTTIAGCSKFVEKPPLDNFSDGEFWKSEANVVSYTWGFYAMFDGFGTGTNGDFYFTSFSDDQAASGFSNYDVSAPASDSRWTFDIIRKANIMLEKVDIVPMDDSAKMHWKGVAHFFRALSYFRLVKVFGDVPWISKSLDISEDGIIYKPRDPRGAVMDSVLGDLNFAVSHLREKSAAAANTVNKDVALALMSRVGLYEGAYRKYHTELNLTGAETFLMAAKNASAQLMAGGYQLNADFRTVYSSLELSGDPECMLYRQYTPGILGHSLIGYTNSSTTMNGLTKNAIESYLCTDGLPIKLSADYAGDATIEATRTKRDKRLTETISDFLCYKGHLVEGLSSSTGYRPAKFLQPLDANQLAPYNSTDAPLFWLPEILLNYAEACAELDDLGKYTIQQADLDKSVNLLRARGGIPDLELKGHQGTAINGNGFVDPDKDADVSSLIWEVRRERRTELMLCGFRYDDLMRWKKGWYMDNSKNPDIFLGAKVATNSEVPHTAEGYIAPYKDINAQRVFEDPKNYLDAVPTGQISLYPPDVQDGMQNPGW